MNKKQLEMMAREHDMTAIDAEFAEEVAEVAAEGAVNGCKKIETGAVEGFGKVVDKCVEALFAKEGESVEDAKKRLNHKGEK